MTLYTEKKGNMGHRKLVITHKFLKRRESGLLDECAA